VPQSERTGFSSYHQALAGLGGANHQGSVAGGLVGNR
jgi:hypothetical protein